jgi:hypothetical protein
MQYESNRPAQTGFNYTHFDKREFLSREFKELERVGNILFDGYLDPRLVGFDLSVIRKLKR